MSSPGTVSLHMMLQPLSIFLNSSATGWSESGHSVRSFVECDPAVRAGTACSSSTPSKTAM